MCGGRGGADVEVVEIVGGGKLGGHRRRTGRFSLGGAMVAGGLRRQGGGDFFRGGSKRIGGGGMGEVV